MGDTAFVSTGDLPPVGVVRSLLDEAHARFRGVDEGVVSPVYPALARAHPDLFGACVAGVNGTVTAIGDADVEFTIMSVAKPFVFALVCDAIGPDRAAAEIGVDATGLPFDSLAAIERYADGRTNPMVNAGAIATVGLVPGDTAARRWSFIVDGLSRFAGRTLTVDEDCFASAAATNLRNRAIAQLLQQVGRLPGDPFETLGLYTRQSCLRVTVRDLAVMSAVLADGGTHPLTGTTVVSPESCRVALAVMAIAGLYETSGQWLVDVGLPGKSGISGGIATVSPGKGGLGTFSPPLDAAGNSVRGRAVAAFLARRLGLDIFASAPHGRPR